VQCLPLDQVPEFERRLFNTWSSKSWTKRRDALALSLCLMGLRWEEVSRALVCDVGADGTLWVRTAKKGTPRRLPIGEGLCSALRDLVANSATSSIVRRRSHQRLFFTKSGSPLAYTALCRTCKLWTEKVFRQPFTLHCLRHTCAARVYRATRDVLAVQRILGHVSLRSTAYYLSKLEVVSIEGLPAFATGNQRPTLRLFDPEGLMVRRA